MWARLQDALSSTEVASQAIVTPQSRRHRLRRRRHDAQPGSRRRGIRWHGQPQPGGHSKHISASDVPQLTHWQLPPADAQCEAATADAQSAAKQVLIAAALRMPTNQCNRARGMCSCAQRWRVGCACQLLLRSCQVYSIYSCTACCRHGVEEYLSIATKRCLVCMNAVLTRQFANTVTFARALLLHAHPNLCTITPVLRRTNHKTRVPCRKTPTTSAPEARVHSTY